MIREEWISFLRRIADPVLDALERGELKRSMPVETTTEEDRSLCSHMEAFGRLITGIAPWVELSGDSSSEGGGVRNTRRRFGGRLVPQSILIRLIISGVPKKFRIRSFWWIPPFLPMGLSGHRTS